MKIYSGVEWKQHVVHFRDVSIIKDHPGMDTLPPEESESFIDDLPLFPFTPEDTDPPI